MGDQEQPDAAPPAAQTGDGAESVPQIPKPRFDQVNGKLQEALARIRDLESKQAPKQDPAPAPVAQVKDQPQGNDNAIEIMQLRLDHGISRQAAEKVLAYVQKGLDPSEALDFARHRDPALFGEPDRRAFDAATHSIRPPSTGAARSPEPPKEPSDFEKMKQQKNLDRRQEMALRGAVEMVKSKMFNGRGAKK